MPHDTPTATTLPRGPEPAAPPSLRHLRVLLAALDTGRVTAAADACRISQPAASQALAGLEARAGAPLLHAGRDGLTATALGAAYAARVRLALTRLDAALGAAAPRLVLTVTRGQLVALIAVRDAESFTLAARKLGLTQPSVHRAIAQIEAELGKPLFARLGHRLQPTRLAETLADAARLCLSDLDQAEAERAELTGREAGRIVVGAMPLSRSAVLPQALAAFRALRATLPVTVLDGPYDDLLAGLRRGEIDLLIGALRADLNLADVVQTPLFDDDLILVVRPGHPALALVDPAPADLARYPWIVPRPGTPAQAQFSRFWAQMGAHPPPTVECLSVLLMRELLALTDHIGCISRMLAAAEIALGAMVALPVHLPGSARSIGITTRAGWMPTSAQAQFLQIVQGIGADHRKPGR
jgi:LysR family transcriptional regulator, regulator for genes of the gallate degradation pathway